MTKPHDTYASTRRCPSCRQLHSWDFKTCQKCAADMPQERGCSEDKIGAGTTSYPASKSLWPGRYTHSTR